jgi:hypothetical protein
MRLREGKLRDLGGLMLEMFRRDRFREDLLRERCTELLELDARLYEIDALLEAIRRRVPPARCECGAPLLWGSHFCPNCGRPAGDHPVIACALCNHPLPADARYCAECGAPSGTEAPRKQEQQPAAEADAPAEPEQEPVAEAKEA